LYSAENYDLFEVPNRRLDQMRQSMDKTYKMEDRIDLKFEEFYFVFTSTK